MSEIGFSLDWFRITMDYGQEDFRDYLPTTLGGELRDRKAMRPYSDAKENRYFSLHWSDAHPEWRVMLEMSGKQLSEYRADGQSIPKLFKWSKFVNARYTRLDFAVDLFDTGGNPLDVKECFHTSQLATIAKTCFILEKASRDATLGVTVYVGSRSSERLLRVYDKGKQSKTKLDWIRAELEVKGKRAMQFGELIDKEGLDPAGKAYLAEVVEWSDIPWFESIWSEDYEPVNIDAIGRPETDRERWLRTVVIPVISDELESGSEWLFDALAAVMQQNEDRYGHGPSITPRPAG